MTHPSNYMIDSPEAWWRVGDARREDFIAMAWRFSIVTGDGLPADIEAAYARRDGPGLCRLLNKLWAAAPDAGWIHSIPGWGALCDLCSEEWALYPEGQTT